MTPPLKPHQWGLTLGLLIIVPGYNVAPYLREALDSVLVQRVRIGLDKGDNWKVVEP